MYIFKYLHLYKLSREKKSSQNTNATEACPHFQNILWTSKNSATIEKLQCVSKAYIILFIRAWSLAKKYTLIKYLARHKLFKLKHCCIDNNQEQCKACIKHSVNSYEWLLITWVLWSTSVQCNLICVARNDFPAERALKFKAKSYEEVS